TILNSFLISSDCSYKPSSVFSSSSDNGSLSKSLAAVRYVKSPILDKNSSVLLNGNNVNGSCPTLDIASDVNRQISTNSGDKLSLEFIARVVPILSYSKSIL